MTTCHFCDGCCVGATLEPLLDARLSWLWEQIARAADRRGDPRLEQGKLSVRVPTAAEARAAAIGLLGGRQLDAGQTRSVNLDQLTAKLRIRGAALTPGAVAAHFLGRQLAVRAMAQQRRRTREQQLAELFSQLASHVADESFRKPKGIWDALRRNGWVSRLLNADDPQEQLRAAMQVVAALPQAGARYDRRRLAADCIGNPHALDHGSALASAVLALMAATGRTQPRQRPRDAWSVLGIDCDDLTGGLITVGLVPAGWSVPLVAAVTLPPWTLKGCEWPAPSAPTSFVFVTENPSIATAALDVAARGHDVRLVCTSGTPGPIEIEAIARLTTRGWGLAVRADFDPAGIGHVSKILQAAPQAVPWRMGKADYLRSLRDGPDVMAVDAVPETPWEPALAESMRHEQRAAYEEALLPVLVDDLRRGAPG